MISSGGAALRSLAIAHRRLLHRPAALLARRDAPADPVRRRGCGRRAALRARERPLRAGSPHPGALRRDAGLVGRGKPPRLCPRARPRRRLRPARPRALHRPRSLRSVVAGRPARGLQCDAHDGAELERGRSSRAWSASRAAWSPDGRSLALIRSGGALVLVQPGGANATHRVYRGADSQIYSVAFTPDGRFISYTGSKVEPSLGAGRGWTREAPRGRLRGHLVTRRPLRICERERERHGGHHQGR